MSCGPCGAVSGSAQGATGLRFTRCITTLPAASSCEYTLRKLLLMDQCDISPLPLLAVRPPLDLRIAHTLHCMTSTTLPHIVRRTQRPTRTEARGRVGGQRPAQGAQGGGTVAQGPPGGPRWHGGRPARHLRARAQSVMTILLPIFLRAVSGSPSAIAPSTPLASFLEQTHVALRCSTSSAEFIESLTPRASKLLAYSGN